MSDFTIALSGLSDNDAAAFDAAVGALPDDTWQIVNGMPATLLVVDIDTVWGHMDWLRATASGQTVAAYTREAQVRNCELVLHKPLQGTELAALLARVEDMEHPSALPIPDTGEPGNVPVDELPDGEPTPAEAVIVETVAADAPADEPVDEAAIAEPSTEQAASAEPAQPPAPTAPDPAATLGASLLAGHIRQAITIRTREGVGLTLDPERGGYSGSSLLKPLAQLLRMPMAQSSPLDDAAIDRLRRAPALPLTRLLWFAALTAHPGQLAPDLDPDGSYHLERWPQIEREFPRHFRIATAMMRGPGTLEAIAAAANAPVGDVADFINAYSVAGYVSCTPGTAPPPPPPSPGMFARLRRPFSRGGADST